MGNKNKKNTGFSLVELIVAVGITAILMTGLSTFFLSTFRNMFVSGEKEANSQLQSDLTSFLSERFTKTRGLDAGSGCGADCAVLRNPLDGKLLPFTYYGTKDGHFVYKDFFVFNGRHNFSASNETAIPNPAGMASGMDVIYVAAPLEDTIYLCGSTAGCPPDTPLNVDSLDIPLDQPMDLTINDDLTVLYVTDAGNNRILKVEDPGGADQMISEVVPDEDFSFPTGLAYYRAPSDVEYLFVADTYNHRVLKITLPSGPTEVVVGAGDDQDCDPASDGRDHTAYFCQLRFPTDVMVHNEGGVESLYIADTGNGRVLRVWDPDPDLTKHELVATVVGSTQISKIDFVFPPGTTIPVTVTEFSNTLHKGRYEIASPIISYILNTTSTGDNMDNSFSHQVCVPAPPDPDVCVNYYHHQFLGFIPTDYIFQSGDPITISGDSYSANDSSVAVSPNPDNINTNPGPEIKYGSGAVVKITKSFNGEHKFYLDLTDVVFPAAFNLIETKIFNELNQLNNPTPDFQTLRIGDGELGTFEDTIEVVDIGGQNEFDFPTGLGFGAALDVSGSPEYTTDFPDYDYTSDFEVQGLNFSQPNDGKILEMYFEGEQGENAGGEQTWESFQLNAKIK